MNEPSACTGHQTKAQVKEVTFQSPLMGTAPTRLTHPGLARHRIGLIPTEPSEVGTDVPM